MDSIIAVVNITTSTLKQAEEAYNKLQSSNQLKISFHQAGGKLATIKATLNTIKLHLENGKFSGDDDVADTCIRTCCDNADFLKRALADVASVPDPERLKKYRIYLIHQGKEYRVEVLVRAIMNNICDLAKHAGLEGEIASDLQNLRWWMKGLDEMISKQDEEDENMRGAGGDTYNSLNDNFTSNGNSTQNNVKENGRIYNGWSGEKEKEPHNTAPN